MVEDEHKEPTRKRKSPDERRAASLSPEQVVSREKILEAQIAELMTQLTAERASRASFEAELATIREMSPAASDFDAFLLAEGGPVQSSAWHEKHPDAATHLFGFKTWTETKLYIWALFLIEPPVSSRTVSDMSDFEKCLITKMRIHRG